MTVNQFDQKHSSTLPTVSVRDSKWCKKPLCNKVMQQLPRVWVCCGHLFLTSKMSAPEKSGATFDGDRGEQCDAKLFFFFLGEKHEACAVPQQEEERERQEEWMQCVQTHNWWFASDETVSRHFSSLLYDLLKNQLRVESLMKTSDLALKCESVKYLSFDFSWAMLSLALVSTLGRFWRIHVQLLMTASYKRVVWRAQRGSRGSWTHSTLVCVFVCYSAVYLSHTHTHLMQ